MQTKVSARLPPLLPVIGSGDAHKLPASPWLSEMTVWIPWWFLMKNAFMSFMFSDWMGLLTDSTRKIFYSTPTMNQLMDLICSSLLRSEIFLFSNCSQNLCRPFLFLSLLSSVKLAAVIKSSQTACQVLDRFPSVPPGLLPPNGDRMYSISQDGDAVEGEGRGC